MKNRPSVRDRRGFIRSVTLTSMGGAVAINATAQAALKDPVAAGAVIHAREGQVIPPTPDGRQVTVKVDSQLMPGVRMSMVTEDLPPNSAIRVHLHQREDEIIFIRMGSGVATLADREVAVSAGAIVYVPQGVWHGLRNNGTEMLGMSAIYSPPGFEQAIEKDRFRDEIRQRDILRGGDRPFFQEHELGPLAQIDHIDRRGAQHAAYRRDDRQEGTPPALSAHRPGSRLQTDRKAANRRRSPELHPA